MRCFVAVLPGADTATQIERCVDCFSAQYPHARRVATADLHLTLAFIGALAPTQAQALANTLAKLDEGCFAPETWTLNQIGCFTKARALWLGGEPCSALEHYARLARSVLSELRISFCTRPFVPHVTVLRHVDPHTSPPKISVHIPWPLCRPQLLQSVGQPKAQQRYKVIAAQQDEHQSMANGCP